MKHFAFFLFTFIMLPMHAQNYVDSTSQDKGALLWKISGNGLKFDSYLYGTFHSVEADFIWTVPHFREVFLNMKQLLYEHEILSSNIPNKKTEKMYLLMPADSTYGMLYTPDQYHFVDSCLNKHASVKYSIYKPLFWFQIILKYNNLSKEKLPKQTDNIDGNLVLLAMQSNLHKLIYLETNEEVEKIENQIESVLYKYSNLKYQAEMLYNLLKNKQDSAMILVENTSKAKKKAYREQNFGELSKLFTNDFNIYPSDEAYSKEIVAAYNKFKYDISVGRNKKWIKKIASNIQETPTLIAIGVGHMIGNEGLIALLREEGFTVEPMK